VLTAKIRPKRCRHCKGQFMPARPLQVACSPVCGLAIARSKREKDERAADRVKREAMKRLPDLIAETQRTFNAYIRERDKGKPCICCGQALHSGEIGGAFDCGHYRSTGSAAHLRFDERNAHGQRKQCNRYGAGRAVDYRIGLIARIGREAVEALESDNAIRRWTRDELRALKATYAAKLRELKETA
jgi:predicted RNA-binding Zn-ribbon protein involved in translation (DUF1610 family)